MRELPSAWKLPEPAWQPMGAGVRWKLRMPDGAMRMFVANEVAAAMGRVFEGRAGMEALGLDDHPAFAEATSLDRIQGLASLFTACLFAKHCLVEWEGMEDPETGDPLDHTDPDNIRAALLHGIPPYGLPMLGPLLGWVEAPHRPIAKDALRLRDLAQDHWSGGAERCRACADEGDTCARGAATDGEICPKLKLIPLTPVGAHVWNIASTGTGLWVRGGMAAAIVGLDFGAALLAYEGMVHKDQEPDFGSAYACFRAVEAGRLQAEADRAAAEKTDG